MHHRDFVSLRHKALPIALHSGKSHIRVLLSTCCMLADCLHGCLSLCMINTHNVFLFFPFSLFVEIIEPTTSSPVTSPGQYPHTFTKYVWVLLPSTKIFALSQKHDQLLLGPSHGCGSGVCHVFCLSDVFSLWVLCVASDLLVVYIISSCCRLCVTFEAMQAD